MWLCAQARVRKSLVGRIANFVNIMMVVESRSGEGNGSLVRGG